MKRNIIATGLLCFITIVASYAQPKGQTKYVILISIDGFRPDFYLEEKWPTPNIKMLLKSGISAKGMRPVVPSITLPDHTTMITGALPAKHGIYFNEKFDTTKWKSEDYKYASEIKVPTLWDAVKQAGGKVAAVRWVVSNGSPSIDYNFTRFSEYEDVMPKSLLKEIEENVTGKLSTTIEKEDFDYYNLDLQNASIAAYIIKKYKPNLLTARVRCTDYFQHEQGREGEKVNKAIAVADIYVGQIIEATKAAGIYNETAFVIVGDHGFEDCHTEIAFNTLLIKAGLVADAPNRGDWKACFKDQFLMLRDTNDSATLNKVRGILENQPPNIRKLYRIIEKTELIHYGAAPNIALAIQPIEGFYCTSKYDVPTLLIPSSGRGKHGAIPDRRNLYAGFIAQGAGLKKGIVLPTINMEDIAPLIAALLGINFNAPDGILYTGILQKNEL